MTIAPKAGTRDSLVLTFATPIDWQGRHLVAVAGLDGRSVGGAVGLTTGESVWTFVPDQPWSDGTHVSRLNGNLEDPAGNRLSTSFEHPAGRAGDGREDVRHVFDVNW